MMSLPLLPLMVSLYMLFQAFWIGGYILIFACKRGGLVICVAGSYVYFFICVKLVANFYAYGVSLTFHVSNIMIAVKRSDF